MKRTAIRIGDSLARAKLKALSFFLSILGPAAFNSCGLYMPPAALYAPPPGDYVLIEGKVTDSAQQPTAIPNILVKAHAVINGADTVEGSATSDSDGSYELAFYLDDAATISLVASDQDGTSHGSYAETTVKNVAKTDPADGVDQIILEGDKAVDIAMSPASGRSKK